jgi:hypothetical protein
MNEPTIWWIFENEDEAVENPLWDKNWKNIYGWYRDIRQPNGYPPAYDDTKITSSIPHMAALGGQGHSPYDADQLIQFFATNGYDSNYIRLDIN